MVVPLGPGKFYGISLPRPRIYTDVKFNDERVDPPVPVSDPLMSWANEAHWSMGGLSCKRLRLMGKIEGNVNKLRAEREKLFKKNRSVAAMADLSGSKGKSVSGSKRSSSISPPPAPVATKRRRFMALLEDEEEEEEETSDEEVRIETKHSGVRRRLVKKLGDDFDRVASERTVNQSERGSPIKGSSNKSESMALRTRSRRSEKSDYVDVLKVAEEVNISNTKEKVLKTGKKSKNQIERSPVSSNGVRTSPRLTKRGSS